MFIVMSRRADFYKDIIRQYFKPTFTKIIITGFFSMYFIQHCLICRPSDFTVSEDAEIESRTVVASALVVNALTTMLALIQNNFFGI